MLVISDQELDKELSKLNNKPIQSEIIDIKHGRGPVTEVPSSLRKVIAEEAIVNGHSEEIAKQFGISKSSVDSYKHGATSTASYNNPDTELNDHVTSIKSDITNNARSKLLAALESLTPEKLEAVKARDAASIAKDMSVVIKNMEPDSEARRGPDTQYIVYAPQFKKESVFETIVVKD